MRRNPMPTQKVSSVLKICACRLIAELPICCLSQIFTGKSVRSSCVYIHICKFKWMQFAKLNTHQHGLYLEDLYAEFSITLHANSVDSFCPRFAFYSDIRASCNDSNDWWRWKIRRIHQSFNLYIWAVWIKFVRQKLAASLERRISKVINLTKSRRKLLWYEVIIRFDSSSTVERSTVCHKLSNHSQVNVERCYGRRPRTWSGKFWWHRLIVSRVIVMQSKSRNANMSTGCGKDGSVIDGNRQEEFDRCHVVR